MILPKRPLSRLPFPRSPTSEEKIVLERVFRSRLLELGILLGEWERALNEHILSSMTVESSTGRWSANL
jgi:hypothetical protein